MCGERSLAPQLKAYTSGLYKALKPIANAYANITGHRAVGLRYDDLIVEERADVQKASRALDGLSSCLVAWRRCGPREGREGGR
jgi:hypothetical protein